jgi:hypothetical protein
VAANWHHQQHHHHHRKLHQEQTPQSLSGMKLSGRNNNISIVRRTISTSVRSKGRGVNVSSGGINNNFDISSIISSNISSGITSRGGSSNNKNIFGNSSNSRGMCRGSNTIDSGRNSSNIIVIGGGLCGNISGVDSIEMSRGSINSSSIVTTGSYCSRFYDNL